MELIYKLDLPELPLILSDNGHKLFVGSNITLYNQYHPRDLVLESWQEFRGIKWDLVNFFYKNNHRGMIHSDGENTWGINWLHQGRGIMEYWRDQDVKSHGAQPDILGSPVIRCQALSRPTYTYSLGTGAYLVNTSWAHRAAGFDNRYVFSLRCTESCMPWAQVCELFSDIIL